MCLLKVVYCFNLFLINFILILICFLVFFLGLRFWGFVIIEIFLLEFEFFFIVEGLIFFIVNVGIFFLGVVGKVGWLICVLFIVFDKVSLVINV